MHVAIAVGTMLLGGWVFDSPADQNESEWKEQAQPPARSESAQPRRQTNQQKVDRTKQGKKLRDEDEGRNRDRKQERVLPEPSAESVVAPTDVSPEAADELNQPTAPTSNAQPGPSRAGLGQRRQPRAPTDRTERARSADSAYHPMAHGSTTQAGGTRQATPNPAMMGPPGMAATSAASSATDKAFSTFTPSSGVSPWLNLFRSGTGGQDNYTTLVQPQFNQRTVNKQLSGDINGLERNTRMQMMNMQQMQQNRTLQGVGTPQYYMNYGNYFPGYGAPGPGE